MLDWSIMHPRGFGAGGASEKKYLKGAAYRTHSFKYSHNACTQTQCEVQIAQLREAVHQKNKHIMELQRQREEDAALIQTLYKEVICMCAHTCAHVMWCVRFCDEAIGCEHDASYSQMLKS
jgi:hypothetical protein